LPVREFDAPLHDYTLAGSRAPLPHARSAYREMLYIHYRERVSSDIKIRTIEHLRLHDEKLKKIKKEIRACLLSLNES
jgi:hypothetical protein